MEFLLSKGIFQLLAKTLFKRNSSHERVQINVSIHPKIMAQSLK